MVADRFMEVLTSPLAVLGFLGQALFFSRWIVQWIAAEREKRSFVPLSFWWLSLGGGILLLIYAVLRGDPVFVLGQTIGVANYTRNIMLILQQSKAAPHSA